MDLEMKSVIEMLERVAAGDGDATASNVLITAHDIADERVQRLVVQAVADGLGVSLA